MHVVGEVGTSGNKDRGETLALATVENGFLTLFQYKSAEVLTGF